MEDVGRQMGERWERRGTPAAGVGERASSRVLGPEQGGVK